MATQIERAPGGTRWLVRLDGWVRALAENGQVVMIAMFAIGLVLTGVSFVLNIHSVYFDGALRGAVKIASPIDEPIVNKQVGFAFAPNWAFTGMLLLPWTMGQLLRARYAVEPLIDSLIERGMLVTSEFGPPDRAAVLGAWNRNSRTLLPVCIAIFLAVFCFVEFVDFPSTVVRWVLASDDGLAKLAMNAPNAPVTLHDPNYEFDWSVAATLHNPPVSHVSNVVFDAIAYFVIAAVGAGFLFAGFLYFLSVGTFFSASHLAAHKLLLVPDVRSADRKGRLGFEEFRNFFEPFVQAALGASLIALAMHLQNVYLRAPRQSDILNMIFGTQADTNALMSKLADLDVGAAKELFKLAFRENVDTLSSGALSAVNAQTYAAAIALVLIVTIVFGYVWRVLNVTAHRGRDQLVRHERLPETASKISAEELKKLEDITVWPLGWATINQMLAIIGIVAFAMWYPRLLDVVVAVGLVGAAGVIGGYLSGSFKKPVNVLRTWLIRILTH